MDFLREIAQASRTAHHVAVMVSVRLRRLAAFPSSATVTVNIKIWAAFVHTYEMARLHLSQRPSRYPKLVAFLAFISVLEHLDFCDREARRLTEFTEEA
jgi:hypothetical protein